MKPIHLSTIKIGDRFANSSGDYRARYVAQYIGWVKMELVPDDFRGTPGHAPMTATVHDGNASLWHRIMEGGKA